MSQGSTKTQENRPNQQQQGNRGSRAVSTPNFEGAMSDLVKHLHMFAEENPSGAALWCFGIGFVLGWRLKPW